MRKPKKPPPDTVGNVRGRMRMLRTLATQSAKVDAREGKDYDAALARHLRAAENSLQKLRRRLDRVRKKGQKGAREGEAEGDLLATLGSLKKGR